MNARIPSRSLPSQTLTTVFTSGNGQAVRLPKEFRFNTKQVTIERRGDEVVLREKSRSLGQALREALADIAPLSDKDAREMELALATIKDQGSLEARAMWADPQFWSTTVDAKPSSARKRRKTVTARDKTGAARS
jgi:antitoxin VapB